MPAGTGCSRSRRWHSASPSSRSCTRRRRGGRRKPSASRCRSCTRRRRRFPTSCSASSPIPTSCAASGLRAGRTSRRSTTSPRSPTGCSISTLACSEVSARRWGVVWQAEPSVGRTAYGSHSVRLGEELKRLGRHSAIYGLGGLVSRILATLLLPLYTHYLPPRAYGQVEILTASTAVTAIALQLGISSAFFRFYFDEKTPTGRLTVI